MSDDKAYLNLAVLDIISASVDFQPIVFKLDFLQRIAVSLNMDELVTELIGHAYRMLVEIDQRNHVNYAYQAPMNSREKRGKPYLFIYLVTHKTCTTRTKGVN